MDLLQYRSKNMFHRKIAATLIIKQYKVGVIKLYINEYDDKEIKTRLNNKGRRLIPQVLTFVSPKPLLKYWLISYVSCVQRSDNKN